jgi:hypothetical protein
MDSLPPETLVEVFNKLPLVAQWVTGRVCRVWLEIIWGYVVNKKKIRKYTTHKENGMLMLIVREVTVLDIDSSMIIEYICGFDNVELFKWFQYYDSSITISDCWNYGLARRRPVIIAMLNKMHGVQISWEELRELDKTRTSYGSYYLHENEPVNFTKFIAHTGLKVDWWNILQQVDIYQNKHRLEWFRYRINVNDIQRIKLIFVKIMIEDNLSRDMMFIEVAKRNLGVNYYGILMDVFTQKKFELGYNALHELTKYPEYYKKAYDLKLLPLASITFMIAKSESYEEMEMLAEKCAIWDAIRAVINHSTKFALRYFNSHRDDVKKYIKSTIQYVEEIENSDILKSLNGYKNSKFSQVYDFVSMKVSDKRKKFEQRRK